MCVAQTPLSIQSTNFLVKQPYKFDVRPEKWECQLPKLDVAGSNPVSRSIFNKLQTLEKAALLCTPLGCLSRRHPNNFLLS